MWVITCCSSNQHSSGWLVVKQKCFTCSSFTFIVSPKFFFVFSITIHIFCSFSSCGSIVIIIFVFPTGCTIWNSSNWETWRFNCSHHSLWDKCWRVNSGDGWTWESVFRPEGKGEDHFCFFFSTCFQLSVHPSVLCLLLCITSISRMHYIIGTSKTQKSQLWNYSKKSGS